MPERRPAGAACGYNAFWIDPGTRVVRIGGQARTSILAEPGERPAAATPPRGPQPRAPGRTARAATSTAPSAARWASAASWASAPPRARRCCRCSTTTTTRSMQTERRGGDRGGDGPRRAHRPPERPPPRRTACGPGWATRSAAGRATPWWSRPPTPARARPSAAPGRERRRSPSGSPASRRSRSSTSSRSTTRRSSRALEGEDAAQRHRGPGLRIRLPRGQLRPARHPGRRARGRERRPPLPKAPPAAEVTAGSRLRAVSNEDAPNTWPLCGRRPGPGLRPAALPRRRRAANGRQGALQGARASPSASPTCRASGPTPPSRRWSAPRSSASAPCSRAEEATRHGRQATADQVARRRAHRPELKVTTCQNANCGRGFSGVDCGYNSGWMDPGTRSSTWAARSAPRSSSRPTNGRCRR